MSTVEKATGTPLADDARLDPVALAEAAAIRERAEADREARRIAAEAEAEATRIKAVEEAEKQRIANERAAMRLEKERADHAARLAETNRKREESERQTRQAREAEQDEQQAAAEAEQEREKSARSWRRAAIAFAIVCGLVALPLQMSFFWSPSAPWLLAAPLFLEGCAWVVLRGAAAAVTDHRPRWHYRLIAWGAAVVAAVINLTHGLHAFDLATAVGAAVASIAGPGVWDLHEHGRIRKRDGKLTWRQRRAERRAEKKKAREQARRDAEKRAEEEAAAEKAWEFAATLAELRAEEFPEVWQHAVKLAAAMGEATVTEAVWKRAHNDIEGADPGEWVDAIRTRNVARRRVEAARPECHGRGTAEPYSRCRSTVAV